MGLLVRVVSLLPTTSPNYITHYLPLTELPILYAYGLTDWLGFLKTVEER